MSKNNTSFSSQKDLKLSNNLIQSQKKTEKLAKKQARKEAYLNLKKLSTIKPYWNWKRAIVVFMAFVVLFGFVLYTFLPILFR